MDRALYLQRIGIEDGAPETDAATLARLQRSHLLNVPFENLDIHWGRPISLDLSLFYEKIVGGKRGGFCYELNGAFEWLLRSLGYDTRLVSARVSDGTSHGPEFDHAAIIVKIGEDEYLADVGFGDFAAEPLRLVTGEEQADPCGAFIVRRRPEGALEVAKRGENGEWVSQYLFSDMRRDLSDFAEMCDYQQYSPESHFTKRRLCSIMTVAGRKTLTDEKFIVSNNGVRSEAPVGSDDEFYKILGEEFGIAGPE